MDLRETPKLCIARSVQNSKPAKNSRGKCARVLLRTVLSSRVASGACGIHVPRVSSRFGVHQNNG